jgi:hypothetical protein
VAPLEPPSPPPPPKLTAFPSLNNIGPLWAALNSTVDPLFSKNIEDPTNLTDCLHESACTAIESVVSCTAASLLANPPALSADNNKNSEDMYALYVPSAICKNNGDKIASLSFPSPPTPPEEIFRALRSFIASLSPSVPQPAAVLIAVNAGGVMVTLSGRAI